MTSTDDDVVAVIGTDTTPGAIRSDVTRAYDGYGCVECHRICAWVDGNGRCQSCGPLPVDEPEPTAAEKSRADMRRERSIAAQMRRDRLR